MRTYGDFVDLDATLPAAVLADPRCPSPVRDAVRAFDDAQDATRAALAKVDEINDAAAGNRSAIAAAIREGKKPPAPIPAEHTEARIAHARQEVKACHRRALAAAQVAEQSIPAHRAELRPLILAPLTELAAKAERAAQEAADAYGQARRLMSTAADLDVAAAYGEPDEDRRRALAAIVSDHYSKIARRDAITHDGLNTRIDKAFADVRTATAGIPVGAYTVDPLAAPDNEHAGRLVAEAEARAARFAMPGDEPIKVGR
ncbi:hypothetical protein M8C11_18825 [Micromonospora sp. CPM1]|uniref:hypothetical protein n=1 Tax=Micromonospora sp. CPM1 TaxID=2944809 RepID=UPI00207CD881|nr:hypothetical protein [Micromonospora sp. CPM1]MCO1616771.1 hypothetical protein [Micromonospora sp. CPM1]